MFCISSSFLCLYLLPGCPDISSAALASLVTDFLCLSSFLILLRSTTSHFPLQMFPYLMCARDLIFISEPDWTALCLWLLDANNIYLSLCMSLVISVFCGFLPLWFKLPLAVARISLGSVFLNVILPYTASPGRPGLTKNKNWLSERQIL